MGSPSRNVQYHPPRLSEDRLNLPQPHSPSLPTHCTAPGNRECARHAEVGIDMNPHMPTFPGNLGRTLQNDWLWWSDNMDDMNERFSAWLAR